MSNVQVHVMRRLTLTLILILLGILTLTACRQEPIAPQFMATLPLLPPSQAMSTPTRPPTRTRKPTWTQYLTQARDRTAISDETAVPTWTPEPTHTPTLTPISQSTVLDLPVWMKDPQQNILMYRMLRDPGGERLESIVHFLNPDTGEQFDLSVPDAFICWHDGVHAVFVHDPRDQKVLPFLFVLNLSDGSLNRYTQNDPLFQTYYFQRMMCDQVSSAPSPGQLDSVTIEQVQNEYTAVIVNSQTFEKQPLTDPKDGIMDTSAFFSPMRESVAVLQTRPDGPCCAYGNQISVYDFGTRRLIAKFQTQKITSAGFINSQKLRYSYDWHISCIVQIQTLEQVCKSNPDGIFDSRSLTSPDLQFMVTLQTDDLAKAQNMLESWGDQFTIYNYGDLEGIMTVQEQDIQLLWFLGDMDSFIYMRQMQTPCVVDIPARTKKCIHAIQDRFPGHTIDISKYYSDQYQLTFLHWSWVPELTGGLCFYDLRSGNLNCPMEGLSILQDRAVTGYTFSPDQKYIAFTYEDNVILSDAASLHSGLAVIGKDGKNFTDLGTSNASREGIHMVSAWRPIPVNP